MPVMTRIYSTLGKFKEVQQEGPGGCPEDGAGTGMQHLEYHCLLTARTLVRCARTHHLSIGDKMLD